MREKSRNRHLIVTQFFFFFFIENKLLLLPLGIIRSTCRLSIDFLSNLNIVTIFGNTESTHPSCTWGLCWPWINNLLASYLFTKPTRNTQAVRQGDGMTESINLHTHHWVNYTHQHQCTFITWHNVAAAPSHHCFGIPSWYKNAQRIFHCTESAFISEFCLIVATIQLIRDKQIS